MREQSSGGPGAGMQDDVALTRRRWVRALMGGVVTGRPQGWHRCPLHPKHTCRHRRTCRHRLHRKPSRHAGLPSPPPGTPTELPPGLPPTPPVIVNPTPPSGVPTPLPVGEALPADVLRVLSRFSYGYGAGLHEQVRAAGGWPGWFEQQLDPASIADPRADGLLSWWPSLSMGYDGIWKLHQDGTQPGWVSVAHYARWCLLRRVYSTRQLHEVISEFWEDHLHIPLSDDLVFPFRGDYGMVVRKHALGRFTDLLQAAITHPAMSLSLDNAFSTKWAPNENLGRELLELHTVGAGNYTEDDVKTSARILTGFQVDTWRTWAPSYNPQRHWTGPVSVLGFTSANADPDGRAVIAAYLDHLAHHPLTARRLARKLAVRFVGDDPPAALVERLAQTYLDHDTDIRPVLRALAQAPELRSAAPKVRTPLGDLVATYRALEVDVHPPTSDESGANSLLWFAYSLGQPPFEWPRPDGPPADDASWSSTSRVLASMDFHLTTGGGWWPDVDMTYRAYASWLPAEPTAFADVVDRLSVRLFATRAAPRVVQACVEALGIAPTTLIGHQHALATWRMPHLLAVLLDSPDHLLH
ncbi:DUF1800 domain-containing protein [Nocardioides albidus]|uniref:DUF1800 domain-containing protein n=1 Tax=Nocardioides albidus TaxID=1517589 RepID=A0A5C4WLA2_9ACTN|nr:DUF1800 domain-containing protein [Nocardioides albidus]TNM48139.1 DUF1800 domain-containing protein [Nocardioides albidus]